MQLPLLARVDFGGVPIASDFTVAWLQSTFLPAQRVRRDKVVNAVNEGTRRIDAARASVMAKMPVVGEKRANGLIYQTAEDHHLAGAYKAVAQRQLVAEIAEFKKAVDNIAVPALKEMERATTTAKLLAERVFDKLSCLGRMKPEGAAKVESVQFRATCAALVANQEPIVLRRMAQNALDGGLTEDFILIHAILNENLKLKRERQAFSNQALIALVTPPEFSAAEPLLKSVVDLRNEAFEAWATLSGHIGQVSMMRMARGLAKRELDAATEAE